MAIVKRSQLIHKQVEEVFRTVVDMANFPKWNPTTPSARKLSSGEIREATRLELEGRGFGKVTQALREFDHNHRVQIVPPVKLFTGGYALLHYSGRRRV